MSKDRSGLPLLCSGFFARLPSLPKGRPQINRLPLLVLPAALSLLWLEGCQFPLEFRTREEIRKEVLGKDPAFSVILDEKAKLDEQTGALKAEFKDKKRLLDKEISSLRKELRSAREYMDSRIKGIDSQLNPCREELKLEIKRLTAELKLKESSFSATKRTITSFSKIGQQELSSEDSAEEMPKPEDKISSLKIQAAGLERDISFLRDEIRINRLKLKLLN